MGKFLFVVSIYVVTLGIVGEMVNKTVTEPYMDEIFHIPQVQQYCAGNFSHWDNKITTLPGLYMFTVGMLDPAHKVTRYLSLTTGLNIAKTKLEELCSTSVLRSVNLVFSAINLILIYTITSHLHGLKESYSDNLGLWSSINISMLPVLYMFSFLYYTDQVSTALVLLTLCLHVRGQDWLAAFTGALSILCRQTNIVWVFFTAALAACDVIVTEVRIHQVTSKHPPKFSLTTSGQMRELVIGVWDIARSWKLLRLLRLIITRCGGYIIVGAMFLVFVHLNNGVVVGDRTAHMVTVHLPQLGYFAAFFTALTLPHCIKFIPDFLSVIRQNIGKVIISCLVMLTVIHLNTLAHPYLLADNRHYTFYLWRKVYMRHWLAKYLLVPVYMFGFYSISQMMGKTELAFKIFLPLCISVNIVPQLLLEFRYFIVPFIIIRLQLKPICWKSLALESCILLLVNYFTIYAFLFKTFEWTSEPGVAQRFMW